MSAPALFPRPIAVLLACAFAGNHIAARIAFDHDTGLLLAILYRGDVPRIDLTLFTVASHDPTPVDP